MKTAFLLVFLFTFLSIFMHAQNTAVLKINLYPVQTIEVNAAGQTTNIDYRTIEDYRNGSSTTMADQLKVFSTGGFAINVKSESATLTSAGSEKVINTEDITITALAGTTNSLDGFSASPVILSTSDAQLLSSTVGAGNKTVSLNYTAKGNNSYINKQNSVNNATTYTTQITFSIEPI